MPVLRVCSIAIGKHGTCKFAISWDLFGRWASPCIVSPLFLGLENTNRTGLQRPTDDHPCGCDRLGVCELIDPLAAYQSPPAVLPWSKVSDLTCSSKQDVEECTAPALSR